MKNTYVVGVTGEGVYGAARSLETELSSYSSLGRAPHPLTKPLGKKNKAKVPLFPISGIASLFSVIVRIDWAQYNIYACENLNRQYKNQCSSKGFPNRIKVRPTHLRYALSQGGCRCILPLEGEGLHGAWRDSLCV